LNGNTDKSYLNDNHRIMFEALTHAKNTMSPYCLPGMRTNVDNLGISKKTWPSSCSACSPL
jgi:hypothetical protein